MCLRVACIPSRWGPCAHVGGARPHQVCRWKEQHAICVGKAKIIMNILCHGCLSRSVLQLVARKQTLGFNKAQRPLVCFGEGGREGLELWKGSQKGRLDICTELRKVICSLGPAAHWLWRMHSFGSIDKHQGNVKVLQQALILFTRLYVEVKTGQTWVLKSERNIVMVSYNIHIPQEGKYIQLNWSSHNP